MSKIACSKLKQRLSSSLILLLTWLYAAKGFGASAVLAYGFGRSPTQTELAQWAGQTIFADGTNLPKGRGSYQQGKSLYEQRCASCHGGQLQGVAELSAPALIGGRGSLRAAKPLRTIESYWPYATTLFDYIRRAMPFTAPGSLRDEEVYSLCAYILAEAKIFAKDQLLDAAALAAIKLPNREGFIDVSQEKKN